MSVFCLQGLLCTNFVLKKTGYCNFGILSARLLCIRNDRQNTKMLVFCLQEMLQYVSGMFKEDRILKCQYSAARTTMYQEGQML